MKYYLINGKIMKGGEMPKGEDYVSIKDAMQEYADQQTKELQQRVEELYLKNKELKTHLTQQIECTEHIKDICDNYESENKQLQAKIDELQSVCKMAFNEMMKDGSNANFNIICKVKDSAFNPTNS